MSSVYITEVSTKGGSCYYGLASHQDEVGPSGYDWDYVLWFYTPKKELPANSVKPKAVQARGKAHEKIPLNWTYG